MIIEGSGSGKTNTLLNLINEQNDIDKLCLYAKNLSEPKYKYLIKKRENAGINHLNNSKPFIECSNTVDDVYESIDDCRHYSKEKISSHNQRLVYWMQKTKYFTCVYHRLIFLFQKM